jgi:hypothetical protein
MPDSVLDTSEKYFTDVLKPEYDSFFSAPASFRSAFNVARSLFHFHEWIYEDRKPELERHFGRTFANKGEFWGAVQSHHEAFGFIRDFANASKHVRLTLRPSTSMTHIANTAFQVLGWSSASRGTPRWGSQSLQMKDGAANVSFDYCVEEMFKYWTSLREQMASPAAP